LKTYFFISDVHLGLQGKAKESAKEKLLIDFLKFAESNCDELFIVGDLFDYWFEYKRVIQKGFIRTLGALASFNDCGKVIHYIIGNHDFLHKDFFEKEIGAKVYEEEIDVVLNDKKFFIAHGDGLMEGDNGYKMLKKVLRNKTIQRVYSLIHPDLGIKIASGSSKASRDYTSAKDFGEFSGLIDTARKLINKEYDYVVFGHSHRRTLEKIDGGMYVNLGTWLKQPCFGKFTNKFEIIDWK
jgi:UDP-2,3-diacylglucosamine hydrolase